MIPAAPELESWAKESRLLLTGLSQRPKEAGVRQKAVRLGLFKPWRAVMDEGWTRFVLEQYGFSPQPVSNQRVAAGNLRQDFEVLILPDVEKSVIVEGKPKPGDEDDDEVEYRFYEELPPDYTGGIGKEGVKALVAFVKEGGTLIAAEASTDLVIEEFNLPVFNPLKKLKSEEYETAGSIVNLEFNPHPVTWGMPDRGFGFLEGRRAFATIPTGPQPKRTVLAQFPADGRDILASGWMRGPEKLERKAAAVALESGTGKIVLFAFPVVHRAQSEGTFQLLLHAVLWGGQGGPGSK